jgi:outer membrane protein TolC
MIRAVVCSIAFLAASLAIAGDAPRKASRKKVEVAVSESPEIRGPMSLDRAISLALKQNPDLQRALQEIERTRGQVIEVRAQALPHVGLNANYFQQDKYLLERSNGGGSGVSSTAIQFKDETGQTVSVNPNSGGGSNAGSSATSFGASAAINRGASRSKRANCSTRAAKSEPP